MGVWPNFDIKIYILGIWLNYYIFICSDSFSALFGNRVLGKTFGPKREEVAGGWRRLHNEEFHKLNIHQILFG
jgi:hypothetical protein